MKASVRFITELETAIENILEDLRDKTQADAITFHYYDQIHDRLILPVEVGLVRPRRFKAWLPSMDRIAGRIVKSGEPVVADDAEHHSDTAGPFVYVERVKSSAGFSLITATGETVGVLFVNYRLPHPFTAEEEADLKESATQIADTIRRWLTEAPDLKVELSALAGRRREEAAIQEITDSVRKALGDVAAAIWMPGEHKDELVITAQSGLTQQVARDASLSLVQPGSVMNAFRTHELVKGYALEGEPFHEEQARAMRLKTVWAFPILSQSRALGVLCVYPIGYDDLTPREETVVHAFVEQAAATVENHHRILTLTVLNDLGRRLTFTLADPHQLMQEIVASAAWAMGADSVVLHQYDQSKREFYTFDESVTYGLRPYPPSEKPREHGVSAHIVEHGLVNVPDIDKADPQLVRTPNVLDSGVKSYLGIRLKADENVVGVLFFNYNEKREFSPDDLTIATTFANYAATAIHNSRLYQQAKGRAETLARLHEVGRALVAVQPVPGTLPEVLRRIAENARTVLNADLVDLYQYIQERDRFLLPPVRAGKRRDPRVPKKIHDDDVVMQVIKKEKPQYFLRSQEEPLLTGDFEIPREGKPDRRFVLREGILSSAAIPLQVGDETVGVMFVNHRSPQTFPAEQREVIELFANQAATAIYNTRLFQRTRNQAQALTMLSEVAQRLVSIQRAPESTRLLLEQIAESAKEVLNADIVELYEYLPDQERYRLPQVSVGERRGPLVPKDKVYEDDAVFQLIQREEPLYIERARNEPIFTGPYTVERTGQPTERYAIREGLESVAAIPLQAEKETVGLMFANFRSPQVFTIEQKRLIELFANQAATAIHNTRLFQRTRNQAQALTMLSEVAQRLVSIQRAPESTRLLLEQIAESAKEVLNADIVELYEYLPDQERYRLPQVSVGERRGPLVPKDKVYEDDAVFQLIQREEPLYIERARNEPIFTGPYTVERTGQPTERYAIREGLESVAAIPLQAEKETVGLMFANFRSPQVFTIEQKRLIELFANQAAVAIHNTRLYEESLRKSKELQAVGEIAKLVMSTLDTEEVPRRLMQQIVRLFGAEAASLWKTDRRTGMIEPVLVLDWKGEEQALSKSIREMPPGSFRFGKGILGRVAEAGTPMIVNDVEAEPWWDRSVDAVTGFTTKSILAVPLVYRQVVVGIVEVVNRLDDDPFTVRDQELLTAIASSAAIALENARLYERKIEEVRTLTELGQELAFGAMPVEGT